MLHSAIPVIDKWRILSLPIRHPIFRIYFRCIFHIDQRIKKGIQAKNTQLVLLALRIQALKRE